MTHTEAQARCDQLNREHPDRATHRWMAREAPDGDWQVAKVNLPGRRPVHATTAEKAQTPPADDPRSNYERNIGGPYGPG
jgi:hypothetical protein